MQNGSGWGLFKDKAVQAKKVKKNNNSFINDTGNRDACCVCVLVEILICLMF